MHGYVKLEIFRFNLFGGPNLIQMTIFVNLIKICSITPIQMAHATTSSPDKHVLATRSGSIDLFQLLFRGKQMKTGSVWSKGARDTEVSSNYF